MYFHILKLITENLINLIGAKNFVSIILYMCSKYIFHQNLGLHLIFLKLSSFNFWKIKHN